MELNISANDLEEIPPSIGLLRHLRTLYADENFIIEIPPEVSRAIRLYSCCFEHCMDYCNSVELLGFSTLNSKYAVILRLC